MTGEDDVWPLFALKAWAQSTSAMKGTTGECAALASDRLSAWAPARNCGGGHDS